MESSPVDTLKPRDLAEPDPLALQARNERRKKVLLGLGVGVVGIVSLLFPFISPALRGRKALPYVPATDTQIRMILEQIVKPGEGPPPLTLIWKDSGPGAHPFNWGCLFSDGKKPNLYVDLGSGDGRVVLAMARQGIRSVGIELNAWLVLYSKFRALTLGLSHLATFRRQNLWKADLSRYDALSVFGVKEMMPMLEEKLSKEMQPEAVLVACRFKLPRWKPLYAQEDSRKDKGLESVWVYRKQPTPKEEVHFPF